MKSKKVLYALVLCLVMSAFGFKVYASKSESWARQAVSTENYMTIRDMGFENSSVYPVYVDNSTNDRPEDTWVEIRNSDKESLLIIDKEQAYIDEETGLLMISSAYYESHIKPIIENNK